MIMKLRTAVEKREMVEYMGDKGAKSSMERVDRRVLRTRRAIREALLRLLTERDYRKITVTDLTREAGIDRKTFYLHYRTIDDVISEALEEETSHIVAELHEELKRGGNPSDVARLFMRMERAFVPDVEQQRRVLANVSPDGFLTYLETPLRNALVDLDFLGLTGIDETHRDYCATFFAAGLTAMYRRWLLDDSDLPIEDLAELASRAMMGGIGSLVHSGGSRRCGYDDAGVTSEA